MKAKCFLKMMIAAVTIAFLATALRADGDDASADRPTDNSAIVAKTPPMGWNSWDGYGTTINEEQFKANAKWFAEHLKKFGWEYVTIDMEWFVTNQIGRASCRER